jgi:peptidoglycan hydrolase-like protein with peptidoglycan-binding domain
MKQIISAFGLVVAVFWTQMAIAQSLFVQIEAHSNLTDAQDRARDFSANLNDVNGFRMSGGWYALAIGPYDEDGAVARMQLLKARGAIPADSFLVDSASYSQQFFPIGSNALSGTVISTPRIQPEAPVQENLAPLRELVQPEIPEENRNEALRGENQLSRQEKFNLQIALEWFGFYSGAIDAAFGPGTRNSMANWQASKGFEPTGILTTRQRAVLLGDYETILSSLGLAPLRDDVAGIELEMPQAMVAFNRYDPPFAHYTPINDSGVTVLLISQQGDENTLLGLYDIMQTLKIVPLEGERTRQSNRFTLTGENAQIKSYTYAVLQDGAVKGFTLIWPAGEDARYDVALRSMRDSFSAIEGTVLPDAYGDGALQQSIDLISGLEIRQPDLTSSGFYVDSRGSVLTTTSVVKGCSRITLDEIYDAKVVAMDDTLGLAILRPSETLSPLEYAKFQSSVPRLQSEVAVSGYSFGGMLGAPTMTFGTLSDVKGLEGETTMKRLALTAADGDAGGPVMDATGSVLGMLLPDPSPMGKRLPDEVSFATDARSIAEFLSNSGYSASASNTFEPLSPEDLTKLGAKLTVLVSCWGS